MSSREARREGLVEDVAGDGVTRDAGEGADASPLGQVGLADAVGAAVKGVAVGLFAGPLGVVDDLPAVGTGVELRGSQSGNRFGFGLKGVEHAVDPLL